jgi:hypothetical protein
MFISSDHHIVELGNLKSQAGNYDFVNAAIADFIDSHRVGRKVKVLFTVSPDDLNSCFINITFKNRLLGVAAKVLEKIVEFYQSLGTGYIVRNEHDHFSNNG